MSEIMKELDRAEELLCKGIKEINDRDELDACSLDNLKDAILSVEKIYKTRHFASEDNDRNGYSQTYRSYPDSRFPMTYPMYPYGDSEYDIRHSHTDGYNNMDNRMMKDNNYSSRRYDGYSRGSMLEHLEHALKDAQTEQEREAIRRIISERS